jgi:hypothetical protein
MRQKNLSTQPNKSQQSQSEYVILATDYEAGMTASDVRLRNMIRNRVSKMRSRTELERIAKLLGIELT